MTRTQSQKARAIRVNSARRIIRQPGRVVVVNRRALRRRQSARLAQVTSMDIEMPVTSRLGPKLPRIPPALYAVAPRVVSQSSTPKYTDFARTLSDPFSGTSCVPDGSRNTGCFTYKTVLTLSTGAAGTSVGAFFVPNPSQFRTDDDGNTASTMTFPIANNWLPITSISTFSGMFGRFRPVSMGIKVVPSPNLTGFIVLGQCSADRAPSQFNGNNIGMTDGASYFKVVPAQGTATVTWRPEDPQDFSFQTNQAGNTSINTNASNLPILFVQGFGLPASTLICCLEVTLNVEGEYHQQSSMVGNDTWKKAQVGWYENTMNALRFVAQVAYTGLGVSNAISKALG